MLRRIATIAAAFIMCSSFSLPAKADRADVVTLGANDLCGFIDGGGSAFAWTKANVEMISKLADRPESLQVAKQILLDAIYEAHEVQCPQYAKHIQAGVVGLAEYRRNEQMENSGDYSSL